MSQHWHGSCEDWQISNDFPFLFYYTSFPFLCIFWYNWSCQLGADSKSPSIELFLFQCRGLSGKEDRPGFSSDTARELDTESETPIVYPYFLRVPSAFNSSKPNLLPVWTSPWCLIAGFLPLMKYVHMQGEGSFCAVWPHACRFPNWLHSQWI